MTVQIHKIRMLTTEKESYLKRIIEWVELGASGLYVGDGVRETLKTVMNSDRSHYIKTYTVRQERTINKVIKLYNERVREHDNRRTNGNQEEVTISR